MKSLEMLIYFNTAFDVPYGREVAVASEKLMELRRRLIVDELNELRDAVMVEPRANQLKELCDVAYVVMGTYLHIGEQPFLDFTSPMDKSIAEVQDVEETCGIFDAIDSLTAAVNVHISLDSTLNEIKDTLDALSLAVFDFAHTLGFTPYLAEAFAEVHRSNMSKIPPDGVIVRDEGGKILKGDWYTPADISKILDRYL